MYKALIISVAIALGLQSCQFNFCRPKMSKHKKAVIKALRRDYNYKPYKKR